MIDHRTKSRIAAAGPVCFSMLGVLLETVRIWKGKCIGRRARSRRHRLLSEQRQRQQGREAEGGRDDQDAASHRVDQQTERQRCCGLRHPRRRADDAQPIAIILRAKDRQRQRAARNGQDAVAGAMKDRECACAPPTSMTIAAPMGCVRHASRVDSSGW